MILPLYQLITKNKLIILHIYTPIKDSYSDLCFVFRKTVTCLLTFYTNWLCSIFAANKLLTWCLAITTRDLAFPRGEIDLYLLHLIRVTANTICDIWLCWVLILHCSIVYRCSTIYCIIMCIPTLGQLTLPIKLKPPAPDIYWLVSSHYFYTY